MNSRNTHNIHSIFVHIGKISEIQSTILYMPHSSTDSRESPRPQTLLKVNFSLPLCFSLICIFSQYKIVNGNYRDSDSLRVINKLWLNVNLDSTFEVSKTYTFCWETSIGNEWGFFVFFVFLKKCLIPGLEVTELQQSHYTIHSQSEIAPSLPDHLLVTAEARERLLLTRISTFGDLVVFFASVKSHMVFLCVLPFFSLPLTQRDASSQST